jgi:Asp-tRNA(Asn)/Glu-tRNA(Gln) amidotransferase A subunit family amidase
MDALLAQHQFLLMPAAPVSRLQAGADHSQTRMRLLRYTAPVSLAGMPAVTIPCTGQLTGAGMQLVAARENDEQLLRLAQRIGAARNSRN